jgi:hypothetical protein
MFLLLKTSSFPENTSKGVNINLMIEAGRRPNALLRRRPVSLAGAASSHAACVYPDPPDAIIYVVDRPDVMLEHRIIFFHRRRYLI